MSQCPPPEITASKPLFVAIAGYPDGHGRTTLQYLFAKFLESRGHRVILTDSGSNQHTPHQFKMQTGRIYSDWVPKDHVRMTVHIDVCNTCDPKLMMNSHETKA